MAIHDNHREETLSDPASITDYQIDVIDIVSVLYLGKTRTDNGSRNLSMKWNILSFRPTGEFNDTLTPSMSIFDRVIVL